ncbi:MAG: amino acid-binding protein [Eggerthellaceae bacterium]|nr:amino acid-binding protein [Eggerthellaceae bacterium]
MISQLTVFLQNEKGNLSRLVRKISDNGTNMHAMFLSDTTEFGIARIFCDDPDGVCAMLNESGFKASVTQVNAVYVPNHPGGLASLLEFCDRADLSIEYGYCFKAGDEEAIDVFKIDGKDIDHALEDAGFRIAKPEEIYAL